MLPGQIRFGIEMECHLDLAAQNYSNLWAIGTHGRGKPVGSGWKIEFDPSVGPIDSPRTGQRLGGYEVVSPILKGEAGLQNAASMVNEILVGDLKGEGSPQTSNHIHIDRRAVADEAAFIAAFKRHEVAFFMLCGREAGRRYSGRWCKPSHQWIPGDRYSSLNLQNRVTYEFRCWDSQMDPETVMVQIAFTVGFVAHYGVAGAAAIPEHELVETVLRQYPIWDDKEVIDLLVEKAKALLTAGALSLRTVSVRY